MGLIKVNNMQIDASMNIDGSIYQAGVLFTGGGSPDAIIGSGIDKITVGTTQPTSPTTGDLWIDTN